MSQSAATDAARIGPNAVLQLLTALDRAGLASQAGALFHGAGVADWYPNPPGTMLDATGAGRLHRQVRAALSAEQARTVLADAGRLTADYLLAHRIPRPAQAALSVLPPALAARALVSAIRTHSWTFAGNGRVSAGVGPGAWVEIMRNPLCADEQAPIPVCVWHTAVFQRLFETLVSARARAAELCCSASGAACCRFEVTWRPPAAVRPG